MFCLPGRPELRAFVLPKCEEEEMRDTSFLEPGKRHKNEFSLKGDGCALAALWKIDLPTPRTPPRLIRREVPQQRQLLGHPSRIWNPGIPKRWYKKRNEYCSHSILRVWRTKLIFSSEKDLNLSLASWKPAAKSNGVYGWSGNEQTYYAVPSGTSIATASAYSNARSGFESWIEVLSLSDSGVEVDTWSGEINDWLQHDAHPSAMAKSTRNGTIYGSVAVTATGNAFAVVNENRSDTIQNWQVTDDMIAWGFVGTVDIGSTWR